MPRGTPRTLRSTCRCTDGRRPSATASAALAVPPPRPALSLDVSTAPPADATASGTHGAPTFRHPAADAPAVLDTNASGAGQPSIVYEEAMAHANDRIDFTPGGRVQ